MNEHELELALRQLSGTVTTLELAVKVLIVGHPDRKQLARIWHTVLPGQIDSFMEHPAYAVAEQRDTIHKMLANFGAFIEMELLGEESEGEA